VRLVTTAVLGFVSAGVVTFVLSGAGSELIGMTGLAAADGDCHGSYRGVCLPPRAVDVDCVGQDGNGPLYVTGPFKVVGRDDYYLDPDKDGVACESPWPQGPRPGVISHADVVLGPPGS
jgi:hypothetical protein